MAAVLYNIWNYWEFTCTFRNKMFEINKTIKVRKPLSVQPITRTVFYISLLLFVEHFQEVLFPGKHNSIYIFFSIAL